MTKAIFAGLILICSNNLFAQCLTTGTISSNCTTTGNMTIDGGTLIVNPGVVVTVTGTLILQNSGTINGTGATFNIGRFDEGWGTVNTINGGTYNTSSFSTGGGSDLAITNANIIATGSIQFENATIIGGTYSAGTTFSTTNGTSTITGANISAGTRAYINGTSISNTTLNAVGSLEIGYAAVSFDNSTINSGTGNAGPNDAVALTMNGGGALTLTGNSQMNVIGRAANTGWNIDNSDVIITGDFDNTGGDNLNVYNNGTINIQGSFNNSGGGNVSVESGGLIDVDGDFNNTGGGSVDVDGGTFVVDGTFTGNNPTGDSGDCSAGNGGCCGVGCGALPIVLTDFQCVLEGSVVSLKWSTVSELNNDYFTIERSFDAFNFKEIVKISGKGTTNVLSRYSYIDEPDFFNEKFVYYRLSQTDFDGTHVILKVNVVFLNSENTEITIFPNPASIGSNIKVRGIPAFAGWSLSTVKGIKIASGIVSENRTIENLNFTHGTYLITFQWSNLSNTQMIVFE